MCSALVASTSLFELSPDEAKKGVGRSVLEIRPLKTKNIFMEIKFFKKIKISYKWNRNVLKKLKIF